MENRTTKVTQLVRSPIVRSRSRKTTLPDTIETQKMFAVMSPIALMEMHIGNHMNEMLASHVSCLVEYFNPGVVDSVNSLLIECYGHQITQAHVDVIRSIVEGV